LAVSFGKYLLENGVVGRHQLEEATQVMVVFGGRLGTILVEAGHLSVEQVEQHLAAYLDRPCAPEERLARPDPEALGTLSADVARRYSAFPMWIEKRTLHVAMLDAHDPDSIDHLAFETGLGIAPYVVAERRLVELLERYYGIRPDPRFTDYRILEMAGHYRPTAGDEEPAPANPPDAGEPPRCDPGSQQEFRERAALGITPLADGEELSDPLEFDLQQTDEGEPATPIESLLAAKSAQPSAAALPEPDQAMNVPRARDAAEVAQLEAEMALLAGRDAIAPLALRIATYFARAAALFSVHDGMIQGVAAAGSVRSWEIAAVYLPVDSSNFLASSANGLKSFRGRPGNAGIDGNILRHLCVEEPKEVAVLPVCLDGRVVNLLYVDNGVDHLAESSLAALEVLCGTIAAAYSRLILESKRRHC
jgi:hypothetical protein